MNRFLYSINKSNNRSSNMATRNSTTNAALPQAQGGGLLQAALAAGLCDEAVAAAAVILNRTSPAGAAAAAADIVTSSRNSESTISAINAVNVTANNKPIFQEIDENAIKDGFKFPVRFVQLMGLGNAVIPIRLLKRIGIGGGIITTPRKRLKTTNDGNTVGDDSINHVQEPALQLSIQETRTPFETIMDYLVHHVPSKDLLPSTYVNDDMTQKLTEEEVELSSSMESVVDGEFSTTAMEDTNDDICDTFVKEFLHPETLVDPSMYNINLDVTYRTTRNVNDVELFRLSPQDAEQMKSVEDDRTTLFLLQEDVNDTEPFHLSPQDMNQLKFVKDDSLKLFLIQKVRRIPDGTKDGSPDYDLAQFVWDFLNKTKTTKRLNGISFLRWLQNGKKRWPEPRVLITHVVNCGQGAKTGNQNGPFDTLMQELIVVYFALPDEDRSEFVEDLLDYCKATDYLEIRPKEDWNCPRVRQNNLKFRNKTTQQVIVDVKKLTNKLGAALRSSLCSVGRSIKDCKICLSKGFMAYVVGVLLADQTNHTHDVLLEAVIEATKKLKLAVNNAESAFSDVMGEQFQGTEKEIISFKHQVSLTYTFKTGQYYDDVEIELVCSFLRHSRRYPALEKQLKVKDKDRTTEDKQTLLTILETVLAESRTLHPGLDTKDAYKKARKAVTDLHGETNIDTF